MGEDRAPRLNRREAMLLLGVGAGIGLVSACGKVGNSRGAVIRSILKDVVPDSLGTGAVVFHEHLSLQLGPRPASAPPPLSVDGLVEVVKSAEQTGVS